MLQELLLSVRLNNQKKGSERVNLRQNLDKALDWLLASIENGKGGSAAYYAPIIGWSKPYPETTGYLISTLIDASSHKDDLVYLEKAGYLKDWLLSIQNKNGSWSPGLHSESHEISSESVFNTAQIISGLTDYYLRKADARVLNGIVDGSDWLVAGVNSDGLWVKGNYKGEFNPSYYSQVAWPLLQAYQITSNKSYKIAAVCCMDTLTERILENHAIMDCGFEAGAPAFTHTIAYTLRGFLETSRLLSDWPRYACKIFETLEILRQKTEISNGMLPGEYDTNWKSSKRYSCLTGNCQLAICFMIMYERDNDLRWFNAACKLIEFVATTQKITSHNGSLNGAIAGSFPVYGRYMRFRYPNWAVKYFADALIHREKILKSLQR